MESDFVKICVTVIVARIVCYKTKYCEVSNCIFPLTKKNNQSVVNMKSPVLNNIHINATHLNWFIVSVSVSI